MSLLKPTPGEIIDRLTILGLKLAWSKNPELLQALTRERRHLAIRVPDTTPEVFQPIALLWGDLAAVNSRIWHREDEIRADLALREQTTQPLNDERARLVRALDAAFGVKVPNEKVWSEGKGREEE